MKKSIICNDKRCYVCGTTANLHLHHCLYGSANRKKSDDDGLMIFLCGYHHNLSEHGVHFDKQLDRVIKQHAERKWMEYYGKTEQDFIKRYGKSYI